MQRALVALLLCLATRAEARNPAEGAQHAAEEDYLLKINVACGMKLSIRYDAESLAKHNSDIAHDQTGGSNECNEPLRYVFYACRSDAGKAAVKRLTQIVCRGTPGKVGALTVQGGVVTVDRAFEEEKPFLRSRKQFEAALKLQLPIQTEDPYYDEDWSKLRQSDNPVVDTKTYCIVNGEKKKFEAFIYDSFIRRKEDATIKCWENGEVTIDLAIKHGVHSGFSTTRRDKSATRTSYRNGKEHGERRTTEDGKPRSVSLYEDGKQLSSTDYHPNGRMSRYSRTYADHIDSLSYADDGRVLSVSCSPAAREDKTLRKPCGFEGAVTHQVYDGTGKVSHVVTWKDGVIQKEAAGTSQYGSGSTVAYVDGKKHGEERVVDHDGKLRETVTWNHGQKDGKEKHFFAGGQKVEQEIVWKADQTQQQTLFYMNGNPRERDSFESPTKKRHQQFWDTGKTRADVLMLRCEDRWRQKGWCEEGVGKTWHENGQLESETHWKQGKRHGGLKSWFDTGKPRSVEEYADDKCTKARRWDSDGKLVTDEEYEADGSRKVR